MVIKDFFTGRLRKRRYGIALLLVLLLVACQDDNNPIDPEPEDNYLVDASLVYSASSAQIRLLAQFAGLGLDINEFASDVDLYTVRYNTVYNGTGIVASGLIALPKTTTAVGMLSYQHGTIIVDTDAPSNFSASDPEALLYGALASSGFIMVVPDYLGFGASASILHPYFVESATASAVVDLLHAAVELADEKKVTFNKKLFLAGYSEGGYATMAAHKAIETDDPESFDLIASFAGAGAYDVTAMQAYIFGLDTYDDPYYLAYLIRAYQLYFDFPTAVTDFFQDPYAGRIPGLFDGKTSSGAIDVQLTTTLSALINQKLADGLDTDPAYKYLKDAFAENSLTDWAPEKKLFMYHGLSDTTVPYENSVSTYDALKANGAADDVLSLTTLPGTHNTAVAPYIIDFVPKLWALR